VIGNPWGRRNEITYSEGLRNRVADAKIVATTSGYFRATIVVTLGTNEFTLYSHLQRSPTGEAAAAVLRSIGTD